MDGVFRQGDTNRVADAVSEQGADADGALDAAIFAIARLGDAEVDRVVPVAAQRIEMSNEQAIGLDHDLGIAGLHREEEIVEIMCPGDAGKLQCALHHAVWCIAMAVHDAVAERAMIRADAHGSVQRFALLHEGHELLLHVGDFLGVFGVGVFLHRELLFVGIVAGIDAHFFHPLHGLHGGVGFKMDVGDERDITARRADAIADVLEVLGDHSCLGRDTDDLTADGGEFESFFDAGFCITRVAGEHRLHTDGIPAADADIADHADAGFAALVMIEIGAVTEESWAGHRVTMKTRACAFRNQEGCPR